MRKKFLSKDYKDQLANIAEKKGFTQQTENLLLSMCYKIEDSYANYEKVKRVVPDLNEFLSKLVYDVKMNCDLILLAEPKGELEQILKKNKCTILTETDANRRNVITYPNEKTLLYGISKLSLPPLREDMSLEERAIMTAVNIGKCISISEVIRDFNGWSWSILENEIESTECNIIYVFLSILLGNEFFNVFDCEKIKSSVSNSFYNELNKVATQFYMSYDKKQNEAILKRLAQDKKKLEKMKNQSSYVLDITEKKHKKILEIKNLDELLNNPMLMREEYLKYNEKMPDEKKIFSVSHYAEKIQEKRDEYMVKIEEYNKMLNPMGYMQAKEKLEYEIKFFEDKTDITKLEKSFCNMLSKKIDNVRERKEIVNLIYELRYLHFLPNCKLKLNALEEKLIPKAIKLNVLAPVSNNDTIDYRILKGIFESQVVALENLTIKLGTIDGKLNAEIYDGDILDSSYIVELPEGSTIEIKKSRKMKIFSKLL